METLSDMAGLSKSHPGLAIALTVLSFSAMGIPPLPGFFGKVYVFKAAIDAGQWPVAVIGLVASVIAAYYYLRLVKVIWLDPSPGPVDKAPLDARTVAYLSALFALPGVVIALAWLDPFAATAGAALSLR
jgi:NADH-quinone oxidoreductase subunit N